MLLRTTRLIGLLAGLCTAGAALAQERAISVNGTGEVMALPSRLEIEMQAAGMAELTGDAIIKYEDSLRRITQAFDGLKMDALQVEQGDLAFSSAMPNNVRVAGRNVQPKQQVAITQSLKLTLKQVDGMSQKDLIATVGKLIDTAQDAGATIHTGTNTNRMYVNQGGRTMVYNQQATPMVAFLLDDLESLHDRAYEKAYAEATTRAKKLARLAHARLGQVLSIDESGQGYYPASGAVQQTLATIRLTEIPIRVSLRVRFSLIDELTEKEPERHAQPKVPDEQ